MTRRIAVVTTTRADFGIYRPLLKRLAADDGISLHLIAGGMHLRPEFGMTIEEIGEAGFAVAARVDLLSGDDSPLGVAEAMARATRGFAEAYAALAPDIAVLLGDRFEMHAAAVAAQPLRIPLAHLHGGELTLGALDDSWRHSMTKLAHLHFVATDEFRRRVLQMGEEPWRVVVCGALGLDNLIDTPALTAAELEARIGLPLTPVPLLVTFHPETRDAMPVAEQAGALLEALDAAGLPVVFTAPNADAGGREIRRLMEAYVAAHPAARMVDSLGTPGYFALMGRAAAMVGNSSSGIIEAASFTLPVVNIGDRQQGRPRAANVIDVARRSDAILAAIRRATSETFRTSLAGLENPYAADHPAGEIIHRMLASVPLDDALLKKGFIDLPQA
ncbi:MAG: UDP-N-acetylglucosamine 2-epimerase (hydrolyzing) [Rhodospirillales bacterium]|nr:UDP-N-acetylglucosamine 2-epimerase (hydrolyzing) [Rhodospirillales bacterium]